MSTYRTRHNKENPYVMLNKGFLEDPSLSAKAKGILAYLLSRPDDWQTHTDQLAKVMKDGRDSILSGLKELERAGYFMRYPVRDPKNHQITHWVKDVFECPQSVNKEAINGKSVRGKAVEGIPDDGNPDDGNPDDGMPCEEKPDVYISNEELNNDKSNIELLTNDLVSSASGSQEKEKKHFGFEIPEPEKESKPTSFAKEHTCEPKAVKATAVSGENKCTSSECDNNAFVATGNIAPDGKTRLFDQRKGVWKSKSDDPWMLSASNPNAEFKQWLFQRHQKSNRTLLLADAAAEIRNDYTRASDLWEEYQEEIKRRKASDRVTIQITTPVKPACTAKEQGNKQLAFYRAAIKNVHPMFSQMREKAIAWAKEQNNVALITDPDGAVVDLEEF